MKIIEQKEEKRQLILEVELDEKDLEESKARAYKAVAKKVDIPGFRKGKAPKNILDSYVGKDAIFDEALEDALPKACEAVIKDEKIEFFAQPSVELKKKEPVTFTAVIPLAPVVELGDYKKVKAKEKKTKITEKEIKDTLEELRNQRATWEPVERTVKLEDMAVIDVIATLEGSEEDKPFIDYKQAQYPVKTDAIYPIPGFSEQLVGLKKDEEKEFELTYPKDYEQQEMAEKKAMFKVKLNEIKEKKLPELNDEFAKEIEPEVKGLADLKAKIKESIKIRMEEASQQEFEENLVSEAIKLSKIEYPLVLEEFELENILNQHLQRLSTMLRSKEDFEKAVTKEYIEELKDKYRPVAERRVTQSLLLNKIAAEEKIDISDEEVDEEIEKLSVDEDGKQEEKRKALSTDESKGRIKDMLATEKILDILKEAAAKNNKKQAAKKTVKSKEKKLEGGEENE